MAQWATFVWVTGVVLTILLALARLSQSVLPAEQESVSVPSLEPGDASAGEPPSTARPDRPSESEQSPPNLPDGRAAGTDPADRLDTLAPDGERDPDGEPDAEPATAADAVRGDAVVGGRPPDTDPARTNPTATHQGAELSTGALLANVAFTQGLFGAILLAAAWYAAIPASAFGVTDDPLSTGLPAVAVGVAFGVALYVANELGAATADAMGVEYDERLRSMLSPESPLGWLALLGVVLPVIAGFEELLFRAALIGATSTGFGVSPWALAVVSSVAFAFGHGAQGRVGVVVTGALGLVLAAGFILTGSFLVVFVAHYLVNALEFVVHEMLGIDWASDAG